MFVPKSHLGCHVLRGSHVQLSQSDHFTLTVVLDFFITFAILHSARTFIVMRLASALQLVSPSQRVGLVSAHRTQ